MAERKMIMIYDITNIRDNGNFDVEVVSESGKGIKFSDVCDEDFVFWLMNYDNGNVILCYGSFWRFITERFTAKYYFNCLHSFN